jgi:hypothetical protein
MLSVAADHFESQLPQAKPCCMSTLAANGHHIDTRTLFSLVRVGSQRYTVEPATPEHVYTLAANLRPADEAEILGAGHSIKKSLWRGYRNSILCKSAIIDGEVAAMWGLCLNMRPGVSLLSDLGVPWLLTTAAVERLPLSFVKVAKVELAAMKALRPRLENHVAASYAQAIKFLRLIGFTVEAPAAGATGALYCRFHLGFDG